MIGSEACSPEEIRAELRRVSNAPTFETSERNRRFLEYVVDETLAGRADRLKGYNIATSVFGRPVNFDPQADPVVRMEAGRLRRSLERYYLTDGSGSRIRIVLPKGTYVPEFHNALDFRSSLDRTLSQNGHAAFRRLRIVVVEFEGDGHQTRVPNCNRGLTLQLMVGLSRMPSFWVFAPGALLGLASERDWESRLGNSAVEFVLTGSTALFADILKVTTMLAHAPTGRVIWGQTFEQELNPKGISRACDEITQRIVHALHATVDAVNVRPAEL